MTADPIREALEDWPDDEVVELILRSGVGVRGRRPRLDGDVVTVRTDGGDQVADLADVVDVWFEIFTPALVAA